MVSKRIAGDFLPCHGVRLPAPECAVVDTGGGARAQSELTPRRSFRGGMPGAMALREARSRASSRGDFSTRSLAAT